MTEKEYNQCVYEYSDNVYRFMLKNLQHVEDAKDLVQTSFERLWLHHAEVDYSKAKSYLFTIAYNAMIDLIRKNKRISYTDDLTKLDKGIVAAPVNESKRILQEAFKTLNENQKSILILKDYEGYSYEEIGTIMNLNMSQVKVYIHRARLALREYIVKAENII